MVKKDNKTQSAESSPLRTPRAKKKFGLKVPEIRLPHLELVQPEFVQPEQNQTAVPFNEPPSKQTSLTNPKIPIKLKQRLTSLTSQSAQGEVSPSRDYQKVPNSVTRQAIPGGVFKAGKSKQLYDVLYSLTRGSINPKHSVRMSKTDLMKKAGIGSRITFDSIISHFQDIGLIEIIVYPGQHLGNEFKVFTYDESMTSQTSVSSLTRSAQKLDRLLTLETRQTSHSLNEANNDTSAVPKTSLKTFNTDDEKKTAFSDFIRKISEASERITGKKISPSESQKWGEVADLLILELELAAARTGAVSSVPAFLGEVLRRKLDTKPAKAGKSRSEAQPLAQSR